MEKEELERENARLCDLIERYHHHLAVERLLQGGPIWEMVAWVVNGEKLQKEAETLLPSLK